jgi:cytochrome c biogenesis protein CcdA
MDIGLVGALLGGVLTLLSPCSVMLLPAFFSYAFASPREVVARTGVFYLGLVTTLVPMGVLAGTLGAYVNAHRSTFVTVASVIVIVLGAVMVLGLPVLRLPGASGLDGSSPLAVYALGTVYGLAGVCAGPLLGAVLTLAALGGNALYGGLILLVFAAGMALPLLLLALLWGRLPVVRRLVRPREIRIGPWRNTWSAVIGGLLTIGIGVLLLVTDGTSSLGGLVGATDQARLESGALELAARVPDLWVALLAVAAGAAAWILLAARRRRLRTGSPSATPPG